MTAQKGATPPPRHPDRPAPASVQPVPRRDERTEDDEGLRELRTELLADLSGTVVEVGAGNGRNFVCARASSPGSTPSKPKPRSAGAAEAVTAALLNDLDIPGAAAIARQEGGDAARGLVSLLSLA